MKLVLVDFSSVAHPLWHVHGGSPDPNATSTAIVAKVRKLASGQPHVALCIDTGKSFRNDISPSYKAHREARPAALYHQIDVALETLRGDGFPVWGAAGYEADDIVATAVARAPVARVNSERDDIDRWNILIVSADKDLAQLISELVTCFSPMTGKTRGLAEMQTDFGIQPHQVVDFLALVGDASDNVKGADGIGAKKAAALLNTFGNLDDLYAAIDKGEANIANGMLKSLIDFRPRLAEVRALLTLKTDAPIPFEQIFAERVPADVATFGDACSWCGLAHDGGPEECKKASDDIDFAMPTLEAKVDELAGFPHDIIDIEKVGRSPNAIEAARQAPGGGLPAAVAHGVGPSRGDSGPSIREPEALAPVEWEKQLEPRTMNQAVQLAQMMFAARLFNAYGSREAVLSTILAGRELGFQAMASLRAFHIIEGRPTLSAGAIHALVLRSGQAEYFRCTERTAEKATFITKRKGEPEMSLSFTLDEAKQAWNGDPAKFIKSGWGRNPADLCVARALTKLARLCYADVLNGLYAAEEFDQ